MTRRILILILIAVIFIPRIGAQDKTIKREITLYNPYKPSLNEIKKRSFFPDMTDTAKFKPEFRYNVKTDPFMPVYTVSPIKAAVMQPDPLDKLYKSYVNIGLGNYFSPLAEISITNERSKKGAIGFYGRHFSNNGHFWLPNHKEVFAGYMDNDASLFGKKFLKNSVLGASLDLARRTRYAYGYDPTILDYNPVKKDTKLGYTNLGPAISLSSLNTDSSSFSYDFNLNYNYFFNRAELFQHNFDFDGMVSKEFRGFYAGAFADFNFFKVPVELQPWSKYIITLNPFLKKNKQQWDFKLGFQAVMERNLLQNAKLHLYPDLDFGFSVVPKYIHFFAALKGHLENNDPYSVINDNPFIIPDGTLFMLPNTSYQLVVSSGIKGNTGLNGNYLLKASYSFVNNMLFYSNVVHPDAVMRPLRGNFFTPITDDAEVLNLHGELTAKINEQISFSGSANYYKYNLTNFQYAWNKPGWDVSAGANYNLRDKILAGIQLTALGKRVEVINGDNLNSKVVLPLQDRPSTMELPYHLNLNLSAEYRYSKILSLWAKLNNISYRRYYEWAFYPSQQFLFMVGFTYSL